MGMLYMFNTFEDCVNKYNKNKFTYFAKEYKLDSGFREMIKISWNSLELFSVPEGELKSENYHIKWN